MPPYEPGCLFPVPKSKKAIAVGSLVGRVREEANPYTVELW
jgi:hypothetical protein